jgi:hypothetical protein
MTKTADKQPNYVVKIKQNRYGEIIVEEIRVQADDMAMLKRRLNAATKYVLLKTKQMNDEVNKEEDK